MELHRRRRRDGLRLAVSPFFVGLVASGLEPENLATGVTAAVQSCRSFLSER